MTDDALQLRRFVESGDEEAFRALVCRHLPLVYGAALRLANRDASLAEDVSQMVFTDLARKARLLPSDVVLSGWLYQAARFAAAKAVRGEQRSRIREHEAMAMRDLSNDSSAEWERLSPALDAAMGRLSDKDRNAVLLHYFEGKDFRTVGVALGLSDDAAQKRVSRALDKLRRLLMRDGLVISELSLAGFLGAGVLPPVAAGVALSMAKSSLAAAAAMGSPGWAATLVQHLASAKAKVALASLVILLCGGGLTYMACGTRAVDSGKFASVDLSAFYNGGLNKSWTPAFGNNYLAGLGEGRHILKSVPFDVHGIVQLEGREWKQRGYTFSENTGPIRVGALGQKIHLLHANSAMADPPGTTVARLVVNYSDGDRATFDIREGIEISDWWEWPHAPVRRPSGSNTIVAWAGSNPAAEHQGASIRLFKTIFVNPHPEKEIASVDYASAMAGSAPFMVALTIEH